MADQLSVGLIGYGMAGRTFHAPVVQPCYMRTFRKRVALLCALSLITVACLCGVQAQAQTSIMPEATVRRFYEWYLHALNQNEEPLEKHQAEMSKFVTRRLLASLARALKRPEGIDADFFIDAQDWDKAWEKNISTSKAKVKGARATVNVSLIGGESFGKHKLRVGLRKESGVWKIDSINSRLNP